MTSAKELREIALAQEAWGKWNTAPAWNRYHAAKRAEHPIRAHLADLAVLAGGWAVLGLLGAGLGRFLGAW